MILRPEIPPLEAAGQLRNQASAVDVHGRALATGLAFIVNTYMSWASDTEGILRHLVEDSD